MGKLLLTIFLVTVFECYGHYPSGTALQGESASGLGQSGTSTSNNFGWNFAQFQSRQDSEPDVIVMIIEYSTSEQNRELHHHQEWKPHYDGHSPQPTSQQQFPYHKPNEDNTFWYHQTHQYGYERPQRPTQPLMGHYYGQYHEKLNFENQNLGNNPVYDNFNTHANERPWEQYEGNYDNQNYFENQKFNENRPTDDSPAYYDTHEYGNQNQFNQNNQWHLNNMNQGIESDQQNSNNSDLISGTQNPIYNNPIDEISQFPAKPSSPINGHNVAEDPGFSNPLPSNPTDTKMESETKRPSEEEEDFQIDIRFKAD